MRGRTYIATSHNKLFQLLLENPKIVILDKSSIPYVFLFVNESSNIHQN